MVLSESIKAQYSTPDSTPPNSPIGVYSIRFTVYRILDRSRNCERSDISPEISVSEKV